MSGWTVRIPLSYRRLYMGFRMCKGNLMIEHNTQILARGIQNILDKYNTAEECIPCKGDPKRKL